jgi:hypothetical protein
MFQETALKDRCLKAVPGSLRNQLAVMLGVSNCRVFEVDDVLREHCYFPMNSSALTALFGRQSPPRISVRLEPDCWPQNRCSVKNWLRVPVTSTRHPLPAFSGSFEENA